MRARTNTHTHTHTHTRLKKVSPFTTNGPLLVVNHRMGISAQRSAAQRTHTVVALTSEENLKVIILFTDTLYH